MHLKKMDSGTDWTAYEVVRHVEDETLLENKRCPYCHQIMKENDRTD